MDRAVAGLAAANTSLRLIQHNYSASGETHVTSYSKAGTHLPVDRPKFAIWTIWSPNDGVTSAAIQAAYDTYVAAFISDVQAQGGIPVLLTAIPCACITTSGNDATRLSINTAAKALASASVIVADMDAGVTDGASPARIVSAYAPDGTHPSQAGADVLTPIVQTAIQTWINSH